MESSFSAPIDKDGDRIDEKLVKNIGIGSDPSTIIEDTSKLLEIENGGCGSTENKGIEVPNGYTTEPNLQPTTTSENDHETNPYAYLDRDEFTSERFKIELSNMPKFYGYGELKKLINKKLNLNSHKIKVMTGGSKCAYVNFRSDEERAKAIFVLNGYPWKKSKITATVAKPAQDPLVRKRTEEGGGTPAKRTKTSEDEPTLSVNELVRDATIPWWNISYSVQIDLKKEEVNKYMTHLTDRLYTINSGILRKKEGEFICPVENIMKSPVTREYRNKCEFTIGYNPETNEKTVGFRLASYRDGSKYVGPVADLLHLPKQMKLAAAAFESYIRSTDLKPYDPETHEGTWKQLTVRTTLDEQLMMIVVLDNLIPGESEDLKQNMKVHFMSLRDLNITSFFVKESEKHGHQKLKLPEKLFGESVITESLHNLKFRISPESFFQVNTMAAEVMYTTIGSLAEVDANTSLIDVCCGTGTIGIFLAGRVGQSLGLEMVLDAIRDATINAEKNGLSNKCKFFAGKAEDIMGVVISKATLPKIVAIVDPPRSGLHSRVIQCIRKSDKIKSLIYAACDANGAMKNFIDLCRPSSKQFKGIPFIPTKLVPVDLFPNTPHLEYIFHFERTDSYYSSLDALACESTVLPEALAT